MNILPSPVNCCLKFYHETGVLDPNPLLLPSCPFPEGSALSAPGWNVREGETAAAGFRLGCSPLRPAVSFHPCCGRFSEEQEGAGGLRTGGRAREGGLGCHRGGWLFYPGEDGKEGKRPSQGPAVPRCTLGVSQRVV